MKQIPLTKGKFALVDDEDYEFLNQWKWAAVKNCRTWYAERMESRKLNNGKQKRVKMHRLILGLTDPSIKGDHIDFDGLNNQRNNLRIVTDLQSVHNRRPYLKSFSKYKGVMYENGHHGIKRWVAKINKNGKCVWIKRFATEIEAALAYNKKAFELNGEFAYLNEVA